MLTIKITDNYHPLYENINYLYNHSFPSHERREWDEMDTIIKTDNRFNMLAFSNDNEFIGFLNYWNFENFIYVEHFAITDTKRGQGIGTQIMKNLIAKHRVPIVLEVELPDNTQGIRRITFYEELGFAIIPKTYLQPPYNGKSACLPLHIMSNDENFATKNFEQIKERLYKEVYKADLQHF